METSGEYGSPPTWYRTVKAAQYLGVAPWELEAQPYSWVLKAEVAQDAEERAKKKAEEAEKRRRK